MFNMSSFVDQQGRYLKSAPVPIRMAGFESNTLRLQNEGWQISVEVRHQMAFDGLDIQIALKHDGLKQVAYGLMNVSRHEIVGRGFIQSPFGIDIMYMAPMIQCLQMPAMNIALSWQAIDARPEFGELKSLEEYAIFKPIKTQDFEIYIHEKDEKDILDILLKKQDSRQKEIRQNMKRRAYQNGNAGTYGDSTKDNINTDIRHQIVLVS